MKKIKKKKIFCFISFLFILSCCIFYGTRFIKLYLANEEEKKIEQNSLVKVIKNNNQENDNFKEINNILYFIDKADNNYLQYSNILWRIIKINEDNSITAISDHSLASLAFGKETTFLESNINKWMNASDLEYSGILENQLNKVSTYLQKNTTCKDVIDTVNNAPCEEADNSNYFSLLSTIDFTNIGNKTSYVINEENFYLSSTNSENLIWTITDEGKLTLSEGNEYIGIRPTITVAANIDYVDGDGTKDNPYKIEKENSLYGSYVKLGNDIWRVYEIKDEYLRLVLDKYIDGVTYSYSSRSSYHDDTVWGSLAYYLNHDFLNSLPYKDLIKERYWPNGYYNKEGNYDYANSLKTEVNTKVALLSIGNIFLNPELENFFTMTSPSKNGTVLYTTQLNKKLYTKSIQTKTKVVPAITIDKDILTKGSGTASSPYETE